MDERLQQRLSKLEALFARAGTAGERAAAGTAIERLQGRTGGPRSAAEVELKFSLPDLWSVRLFVAVCRKHGVRPYRYPRQHRTTVLVRVQERAFDRLVWAEFSRLQTALELYFEDTVDLLITEALRSDGDDSTLEAPQIGR